jgi:murein peptide amidase A
MRALTAACLVLLSGLVGPGVAFPTIDGFAAPAHRSLTHRVLTTPTRHVLGYSVRHRPIVAWLLAPSHASRSMLVVGSIAGDEPSGITVTKMLASESAIAGLTLWLIPNMNPDGAVRGTRGNAHGVDLNRNFPFRWRDLGVPGSRYYSGPRPSSEPETRAIEAFIHRVRPGLSIWLHEPYGLIDDSQGPRWAERYLARATKLPLQRLPDYPGSAIGWDDHLIPASAFDLELPGGRLGRLTAHRIASAIRALASSFASRPSAKRNG